MNTMIAVLKRYDLPIFCAASIGLSFAATRLPLTSDAIPVVMVCIPALVALGLAALGGWSSVRALLLKPGQWRVRPGWIAVAVVLGLAMRLGMGAIAIVLGWIPAIQLRPWTPLQFAVLGLVVFVFAVPEELGWRGYALPKLLKRYSPLVTGLIAGVLWGTLHLALHLPGMIHHGLPLVPVVFEVTALSVIGTWLYLGSGGNLLVASLFHAAQSFFVVVNQGIPQAQQLWLMAGVYGVVALIVALGVPWLAHKSTLPRATGRRAVRAVVLPGIDD